MTGISVKNLNKSYNDSALLKDFSAFFKYGQCTAVMGPSGCGKTTLINILMGLDHDFTGEIEGMPDNFSVVFQENRLCEDFSVMDNIRMVTAAGKRHGDSAGKRLRSVAGKRQGAATGTDPDIMMILKELSLADCACQKVSELSGGQKRRVAIARALACRSDLIIMDEPFKELDEDNRKAAAKAVSARKKTIILVTHDSEDLTLMNAALINIP